MAIEDNFPKDIVTEAKGVLREFGIRAFDGKEVPHWVFIAISLKKERDRKAG